MKNQTVKFVVGMIGLLIASFAQAATDWSTQDYDLYPGDFNGDGQTDVLYIAKNPSKSSGIALSDGNSPTIAWQSWSSNYLGISWSSGAYVAIVGDFNHDNKADVLLQATAPGTYSWLLLADATGRLTAISQQISDGALTLSWSKDQHTILAADFNGDGRADLFFQAARSGGTNAILLADSNGNFTANPSQTWTDATWNAFKWSANNSVIKAADFNSDGLADLLVQRKPDIVMIDYDIPIPVPVYKPGTFGIAYSPFSSHSYSLWDRKRANVDWSAANSNLILGDFDGDGRIDVIVQGKRSGGTTYLVRGNSNGQLSLDSPVSLTFGSAGSATGDAYRIVALNVTGAASSGLMLQATAPGGTNLVAQSIPANGGGVSVTPQSQQAIPNETILYAYDARGRLVSVRHYGVINNNLLTQYSYDRANNRLTVVTTGSTNNSPP